MNKALHDRAYKLLVEQAGEQCARCKKKPPEVHLDVDHIDNNDKENPADGSNWQLLCRSCNVKKGLHHKPRKKRTASKFNKFKRVRKSLIPITPYTDKFYFTTAQMQKNKDAELPCREFMIRIINSLGTVPKQDLLNATANEYTKTTEAEGNAKTISQDTLANYLAKLTNKINGEYEEGLLDDHAVIRKRDRNPQ